MAQLRAVRSTPAFARGGPGRFRDVGVGLHRVETQELVGACAVRLARKRRVLGHRPGVAQPAGALVVGEAGDHRHVAGCGALRTALRACPAGSSRRCSCRRGSGRRPWRPAGSRPATPAADRLARSASRPGKRTWWRSGPATPPLGFGERRAAGAAVAPGAAAHRHHAAEQALRERAGLQQRHGAGAGRLSRDHDLAPGRRRTRRCCAESSAAPRPDRGRPSFPSLAARLPRQLGVRHEPQDAEAIVEVDEHGAPPRHLFAAVERHPARPDGVAAAVDEHDHRQLRRRRRGFGGAHMFM